MLNASLAPVSASSLQSLLPHPKSILSTKPGAPPHTDRQQENGGDAVRTLKGRKCPAVSAYNPMG
jgi:hypothetical protein